MVGVVLELVRASRARAGFPRRRAPSCPAPGRCGWRRGRCACRPRWSVRRRRCSAPRWRSCGRRRAAPPARRGRAAPRRRARRAACAHSAMTFFALVLNSPMVLISRFSPSSPSASIAAGVLATREQRARGLVDAHVGRLRRQHHRDQQLEGRRVVQFGGRLADWLRAAGAKSSWRFSLFMCRPSSGGLAPCAAGHGSGRLRRRCSRHRSGSWPPPAGQADKGAGSAAPPAGSPGSRPAAARAARRFAEHQCGAGEQRALADEFAHGHPAATSTHGEAEAHGEAVQRRAARAVARGEGLGAADDARSW